MNRTLPFVHALLNRTRKWIRNVFSTRVSKREKRGRGLIYPRHSVISRRSFDIRSRHACRKRYFLFPFSGSNIFQAWTRFILHQSHDARVIVRPKYRLYINRFCTVAVFFSWWCAFVYFPWPPAIGFFRVICSRVDLCFFESQRGGGERKKKERNKEINFNPVESVRIHYFASSLSWTSWRSSVYERSIFSRSIRKCVTRDCVTRFRNRT